MGKQSFYLLPQLSGSSVVLVRQLVIGEVCCSPYLEAELLTTHIDGHSSQVLPKPFLVLRILSSQQPRV